MAEYIIQDSTLQGIADAIRSKTGDTAPIQTDAFANAISLIETGGGGDTSIEDGLVDGTLRRYTNSRVTSVASYLFHGRDLSEVNMPKVVNIGANAFSGCSKLKTINFPSVESIGTGAFYGTSITEAIMPFVKHVGNYAFSQCLALEKVYFPLVETIASAAFALCSSLESADFPLLTTVNSQTFSGCTILSYVNLPNVTALRDSAFRRCYSISDLAFPKLTDIRNKAFETCPMLFTLRLPGPSVCSLYASTVFSGAGITSSTGSIYVPASLLTAYQTATNWAYFSTQFVPIEE